MDEQISGIILVFLAAFFQGTFALFLKFVNPWKWENFWSVFSVVALVVSPIVWSFVLVPNFASVLYNSPSSAIAASFLFGMLWGVGSVLFGLSVERIGLSLTYSLIIGLTIPIGSLMPLFLNPLPSVKAIATLVFGILIIFAGLAISAYAGLKREGAQSGQGFKAGLIIATISGITSPMLNIGFVYGKPILETAKLFGAAETSATLPIWVVALLGGFLVNISYTIYLLARNKTIGLFVQKIKIPLFFSVISGIFWFAGIGIYGAATTILGSLGASVGYGLMMSLTIVVSNVLGILTKEWKGSRNALKYQFVSIGISIFGIIAVATSFSV